jgi:FtsP/CotA-like multicopper oxidase with cupredoxin domain
LLLGRALAPPFFLSPSSFTEALLFTPLSHSRNHPEITFPFGASFPTSKGVYWGISHVMACFGPLLKKISPLVFMNIAGRFLGLLLITLALAPVYAVCCAQDSPTDSCPRPAVGSLVPEPEDLRSENGVLKIDLTVHNFVEPSGSVRYCYTYDDGSQSPTLRLNPGDLLVLNLKNDLSVSDHAAVSPYNAHAHSRSESKIDPCLSGVMSATSTNLHFHGLTVPAVCHQDDVLKTSIQPGDAPFEYRFRIPANEPPGLYWYHPHIHGFSKMQVLGGASGALIVEGIERANRQLAGLPERVLVIRDQDLLNPNSPPSKSEPVVPRNLIDNGTGFGKPAKDLSINFVPIPYPDYPTAEIKIKPEQRQLWRVLNASAITYLNLSVIFKRTPQMLGIVALDGVPLNANGDSGDGITWANHIGVPPGGRVEFIVKGPPAGVSGLFVTRTVDTGIGGENDPNRALATIVPSSDAPEPRSTLAAAPEPLPPSTLAWLGSVAPARTRKLYFSEKLSDPNDPNSATTFYITVDGQTPTPFDPRSSVPDIVVKQGDVEDWIIENRSTELHAFHIHQIHFMMLEWSGVPVNEPFLRDTINVPFYTKQMLAYPNIKIRMDFRDPNSIGTYVYHCHLLEHEDGGMMGLLRVEPADGAQSPRSIVPSVPSKAGSAHSITNR